MLSKLGGWKQFILLNIESSKTPEHLEVCWECIQHFASRYSGFISPVELSGHLYQLESAYLKKQRSIIKTKETVTP